MTAAELLVFLKPRLELSHQLIQKTALGSAAATGIDYASAVLMEDRKNGKVDSLDEEWAGELSYRMDDIVVSVQIEDEERKFPISLLVDTTNVDTTKSDTGAAAKVKEGTSGDTKAAEIKINEVILAAFHELLLKLGIPDGWAKEASDSLADWIDGDNQPRSFGAENEYYGIFGYQARNALPETIGELRYIKGFYPEVAKAVFPRLSLFSEQINLNTASKEVLESLFGSDETLPVYFLMQGRPFESVEDALKLAQINSKIYNQLEQELTVTSSVFSVWSTAVDGVGRKETVYAVLRRDEKNIRVIYWNQVPHNSQSLSDRE